MEQISAQRAYTTRFYESLEQAGIGIVHHIQETNHEDQMLARKETADYLDHCDLPDVRRCAEQVITLYAASTNPTHRLSLKGIDVFGAAVLDATDERQDDADFVTVRESLMRARQIVKAQRTNGRSPINTYVDFRYSD